MKHSFSSFDSFWPTWQHSRTLVLGRFASKVQCFYIDALKRGSKSQILWKNQNLNFHQWKKHFRPSHSGPPQVNSISTAGYQNSSLKKPSFNIKYVPKRAVQLSHQKITFRNDYNKMIHFPCKVSIKFLYWIWKIISTNCPGTQQQKSSSLITIFHTIVF